MRGSDTRLSKPALILKEKLPIESTFRSGGKYVDEAIAWWFGCRDGETGLPDWNVFKPFKHPNWLPNVSVSKDIDGRYLCALAGENVKLFIPTKIRGKFIHETLAAVYADDVAMRFNRALQDELPNYAEKTKPLSIRGGTLRYRALYLPFADAIGGIARILSVYDFETSLI